jgi:hypothetical protein
MYPAIHCGRSCHVAPRFALRNGLHPNTTKIARAGDPAVQGMGFLFPLASGADHLQSRLFLLAATLAFFLVQRRRWVEAGNWMRVRLKVIHFGFAAHPE